MPWTCFLADSDDATHRVGAIWPVPAYGPVGDHAPFFRDHLASAEYLRDHADKRSPYCVRLPGGSIWPMDQRSSSGDGHGWTITGEAPRLTASPSINAEGSYHGFLKDGVLSDDVEGRTYPAKGTQP